MQLKIMKNEKGYVIYNPIIMTNTLSAVTRFSIYLKIKNLCIQYNDLIFLNKNKEFFETEEDAKKALDWIESLEILNKLR